MILVLVSFLFFLYICLKIRDVIFELQCFSKVPGPPAKNVILGNITEFFISDPVKLFHTVIGITRKYSSVFQVRVLNVPTIVIVNPYDAEKVLSNPAHIEKSIIYTILHSLLGTGLITSSNSKWRHRRKILTPAFHFNILKQYCKCFNERANKMILAFNEQSKQPQVNIEEQLTQYSLSVICETAMGTNLTFTTTKEKMYRKAIHDLNEIFRYLFLHAWFTFKPLFMLTSRYYKQLKLRKIVDDFTQDIISVYSKKFQLSNLTKDEHDVYVGKKRLAMLDLLLSAKIQDDSIDDEGIEEEVKTFLFAGHDTVLAALQFSLMLIACHPDIQNKILEEVNKVLNGEPVENLSYAQLQECQYLECVLKESLRIYPSVPFISRKLGEDLITHDGYFIPKNSMCLVVIYCIHRDPKIYPDPEKFDPDRFLPENSSNRPSFAFIPFSAGLRNCIGQKFALLELKMAIIKIVSNFILKPVDTPASIELLPELVLRTKDGIKIKFERRSFK